MYNYFASYELDHLPVEKYAKTSPSPSGAVCSGIPHLYLAPPCFLPAHTVALKEINEHVHYQGVEHLYPVQGKR